MEYLIIATSGITLLYVIELIYPHSMYEWVRWVKSVLSSYIKDQEEGEGTKVFLRKVTDKPAIGIEEIIINDKIEKVEKLADGVYQVVVETNNK